MTRLASTTLSVAAALAALLAAAPARADGRRTPCHYPEAPLAYAPAPALPAPPPPAPRGVEWARWRGGRAAVWHVRHEYRELDRARERFYAQWDGNPWRRDRFEAWYATRRAELDRRMAWVARFDRDDDD